LSKKELINRLLDNVPDSQLTEIIDFLMFLRLKADKSAIQDVEAASMSSTDFWDNTDDEVWDHV